MRADRLVATLLLLQTRGRVTAADVAAELEVSHKTARRDLEALAMAGLPVYSQTGRGGGWQLLGGARTDLSGLTAGEARALFLVAGPSSAITPEAKAALRKLARALPEAFRRDAEAAAAAVVLDPDRWGSIPTPVSPHMADLQRALIDGVQVRLGYVDQSGASSMRVVHPLGLVAKGGVWYLITDTAAGQRTFKVSRIRSVELTADPVRRPDGFNLTDAWHAIAASLESRRYRVRAIAYADETAVDALREQFGAGLDVLSQTSDGRSEVAISGSSSREIAEQLAGWGKAIEVIAPSEVRRDLAEIGTELVEAYLRVAPPSHAPTDST